MIFQHIVFIVFSGFGETEGHIQPRGWADGSAV
jgi:hypothetical protein